MSGIGLPGYAKAYAMLKKPHTSEQVADKLKCGKPFISLLMRALHGSGLVHVVGYTEASSRGMPAPIWLAGDGQDAPRPLRARTIKRTKRLPVNIVAFVALIEALSMGPHTREELGEASGLHFHTVRRVMDNLHRAGVVYICGWQPSPRGKGLRVYTFGDKRDKPYPRKSRSEINAEFRSRQAVRRLVEAMA